MALYSVHHFVVSDDNRAKYFTVYVESYSIIISGYVLYQILTFLIALLKYSLKNKGVTIVPMYCNAVGCFELGHF